MVLTTKTKASSLERPLRKSYRLLLGVDPSAASPFGWFFCNFSSDIHQTGRIVGYSFFLWLLLCGKSNLYNFHHQGRTFVPFSMRSSVQYSEYRWGQNLSVSHSAVVFSQLSICNQWEHFFIAWFCRVMSILVLGYSTDTIIFRRLGQFGDVIG